MHMLQKIFSISFYAHAAIKAKLGLKGRTGQKCVSLEGQP